MHVYSGLSGVLQVVDGGDEARGLPTTYGTDDLTLVIQDRRFDAAGRMVYDPAMPDIMLGFGGDTILVNGQVGRTAVVPPGIVRLRLVKASNGRIYPLSMASGREMHLGATDAGYLDAPVASVEPTSIVLRGTANREGGQCCALTLKRSPFGRGDCVVRSLILLYRLEKVQSRSRLLRHSRTKVGTGEEAGDPLTMACPS